MTAWNRRFGIPAEHFVCGRNAEHSCVRQECRTSYICVLRIIRSLALRNSGLAFFYSNLRRSKKALVARKNIATARAWTKATIQKAGE